MSADGRRILEAVDGVRSFLRRRLGVVAGLRLLIAVVLALGLSPWVATASGWSPGSPVPLLLVVGLAGFGLMSWTWWRRQSVRWGGEASVSRYMDKATNQLEGSVQGSLELARALPPGTSELLRGEAIARVGRQLTGGPAQLAGDLGQRVGSLIRRTSRTLAAAVPVVALTGLLAPERTMETWRGLLHPLAVMSEARMPPVTVSPGTLEVARGEVVQVDVEALLREQVSLHWEMTGQVVQTRSIALVEGRGSGELPPITAELRYWVQAPDGGRSAVHTLTPVDPLFVSTFSVTVTYPPHTGLGSEEFRNEVPALILPAGSQLRLQGQGSRAIGGGELQDDQGETVVTLDVTGDRFSAGWVPRRSGTYRWTFSDVGGANAAVLPPALDIQVVPDALPSIEIVAPGPDTLLPISLRQPLVLNTFDDYGLDRVEVVATRISVFGEAGEPQTLRIDLGGTQAAVARPLLDVSQWGVTPGDTIRYFARAVDNHPSGQVARTAEYVLRVPQTRELERAAQEELDRAADRVEDLAEQAAQAAEEARDLQRQSEQARDGDRSGRPGDDAEFEEREEIRQALEQQSQLLEAVDSLQRELDQLRDALGDAGLADPELRDQLRELQELLGEMDPQEGAEEAEDAQERLGEMDGREMEELMAQMAEDQEQLRQRLEESIDQFRQAAIDQDFRATGQEAEDLAEAQELLAEAMAQGDPQDRAEQQAALEARAEDLQQQLETLQERLDQAGEQNAGAGVQEARHQLNQARNQMQQAAQMAQQGQQQQAASQAQEAAGDLSEMSQELSQAQQQMQQQMAEALQQALSATANDALSLARRQTELRDDMEGRNAAELAEMRGAEAALAQGIRNLAENYAEGTQMAAPGSRDLLAAVGQAMESLEATIEAMEGRRGRTPSPLSEAEGVVRALNEVAMLAMTSGEQGQSQGQASASQQMMQQLQQLAQQQGELMNDAASLSPMQLGQEAMQEQMQEMAGEQDQIAEELGELSEGEQGDGEAVGDLETLAEEAMALAQALAQGRLDPEVLRRQERLFHRLLDAGRSLERDEESEEREAEAPGAFDREGVTELTDESVDALRFRVPDARALRALSPAQRALVLEYFQRLNRSGGGSTGGTPPGSGPGGAP